MFIRDDNERLTLFCIIILLRNKRLLAMRNRTTSAPQTSQSPITTNVAVIHNPELFTEMLKPPPYAPKDEYTEAPPPPYTDVTA